MRRVLIAGVMLAAVAFASPPPAAAQERRLNEMGCSIAADMAIVARSLAVEKIEPDQARRIMALVYGNLIGPATIELREKVVILAYGRTESPVELARLVAETCMRTGGDEGAIFGTRIKWKV